MVKLRLAVLSALGAYPFVTLCLTLLAAPMAGWPLWVRTLVLVPLIVAWMVWVVAPLIARHAGAWVQGR